MRTDYIIRIISYYVIGWILLLIGRVALIVLFLSGTEIAEHIGSVPLALCNMLRFDFQILSYIAVIPTLMLITASYIHISWLEKFLKWYYAIVYTLICILTIADLGFYKNFGEHLNVTFFDFFNEGPISLIHAFWDEYPVVWILLAVALVFAIIFRFRIKPKNGKVKYARCIVWIIFVVVSMRGSVTEFPLQNEDIYVSPSKQVNDCVPNAIYLLKKAIKEKSKAFEKEDEVTILNRWGFNSEDEAWATLGKDNHSLFVKAEGRADTCSIKSPNVVLILSESWSGYLCDLGLRQKDSNILCGLDKHFNEDILFQNYQSVHNGTIATIENLTISTSYPRVFMSKFRYKQFDTSFAKPFIESGYKTTFLSGMDEGWENAGIGLKTQGFETIFMNDILAKHPEYKYNSIGIYDHHVMDYLFELLMEESDVPHLFVVMTTTNHPPFDYPDNVSLPAVPESLYVIPSFANNKSVQEKYIKGFQYANLVLSDFLDKVKGSCLANSTIIMATGDHNVRTAIKYGNDKGLASKKWEHSVPLYVYLPQRLRGTEDGSYNCDTNKWGCHYDILPTLAPLTLKKGVSYLNIGQNLLSDSLNEMNTYSYNVESTLADKSCSFDAVKKAKARECLLRLYIQRIMFD